MEHNTTGPPCSVTSPGLCGCSRLQAHRAVLQTTTTDAEERCPYTMCRRASNNWKYWQ